MHARHPDKWALGKCMWHGCASKRFAGGTFCATHARQLKLDFGAGKSTKAPKNRIFLGQAPRWPKK